MGNNKGIKSVFSGHHRAPVVAQFVECASTERHKLAKGDLRERGKLFCFLLEDLQRVD
jgi:hypothetical protein